MRRWAGPGSNDTGVSSSSGPPAADSVGSPGDGRVSGPVAADATGRAERFGSAPLGWSSQRQRALQRPMSGDLSFLWLTS